MIMFWMSSFSFYYGSFWWTMVMSVVAVDHHGTASTVGLFCHMLILSSFLSWNIRFTSTYVRPESRDGSRIFTKVGAEEDIFVAVGACEESSLCQPTNEHQRIWKCLGLVIDR